MRAREILQEDYNLSLESDLNNLLVSAKGYGATELNTNDLVDQLYQMGYSVSTNSILPLLSNNPNVMNATPDMIKLNMPEASSSIDTNADPAEDSAEKVKNMASKASKIG